MENIKPVGHAADVNREQVRVFHDLDDDDYRATWSLEKKDGRVYDWNEAHRAFEYEPFGFLVRYRFD